MKTQKCCSHFLNSFSLLGLWIMKTELKKPNNIWGGGACIKTRNGLWKLNEMEWTKQALRHCTLAFWILSKIIDQVEVQGCEESCT